MKNELKKLGIELAKLAKRFDQDYIDLCYINENIHGCTNPTNMKKYISINIRKEEIEECLQKQ